MNHWFDVGDEIIHFAAVGSGMNCKKSLERGINIINLGWYVDYAISHYNLWNYLVNDVELEINEAFKEVIGRNIEVTMKHIEEFKKLIRD